VAISRGKLPENFSGKDEAPKVGGVDQNGQNARFLFLF
jgi:hypothetical protein